MCLWPLFPRWFTDSRLNKTFYNYETLANKRMLQLNCLWHKCDLTSSLAIDNSPIRKSSRSIWNPSSRWTFTARTKEKGRDGFGVVQLAVNASVWSHATASSLLIVRIKKHHVLKNNSRNEKAYIPHLQQPYKNHSGKAMLLSLSSTQTSWLNSDIGSDTTVAKMSIT